MAKAATRPTPTTRKRDLKRIYRDVLRLMPCDGNVDTFLQAVIDYRHPRPLTIQYVPMPDPRFTGWCLVRPDRDVIQVDQDASPAAHTVIVCHEVVHLFVGHDHTVQERVHPDIAARIFARQSYTARHEFDAEQLATQLATEIRRRQRLAAAAPDAVSKRLR